MLKAGSGSDSGQIVTFYSYKGGTGRSFLLANVAFLLACQGRKVCVIDFDLEAPGLHRYFRPFLEDPELEFTDGLMDWLWSTADTQLGSAAISHQAGHLTEYAVSLTRQGWKFPQDGLLDFIPAGRQDGEYSKRMTSFDWAAFYDRLGGGRHIERAREQLKADYDFVLVDSRTGVSDTAGICTVTLPDRLVACYTLNRQSIYGVDQTLTRIRAQRPAKNLGILLVETRIETNEKAKLDAARAFARPRLTPYLSGDTGRAYWDDMEVVYWPFYAFEESLAIFAEDPATQTKLSMLDTMCRIAGRVSANPVGSRSTIDLPMLAQDVRDAIMADYTLSSGSSDVTPAPLDGVFAEALLRFQLYEADQNVGNLMHAGTLRRLAEAGPLPARLSGDTGFLRYIDASDDYVQSRVRGRRLMVLLVAILAGLVVGVATFPLILTSSGATVAAIVSGVLAVSSSLALSAVLEFGPSITGQRDKPDSRS
jgi:cellulose biosynthesis protein BcsQ